MSANSVVLSLTLENCINISKWKVKEGTMVSVGSVLLMYEPKATKGKAEIQKLKATAVGTVRKLLVREGDVVQPGDALLELEKCTHPTVMKDMCAECGADLRNEETANKNAASIPMVHSIPELKVNAEQAQILGKADEEQLFTNKKLVLLVDLDQTLIHTTNDNIPPNLKDVYHFRLHGSMSPWHHTRLRPGTKSFLKEMSKFYELHICTFGSRMYAHAIAKFLDPDGQYFYNRILSRDECFSANSKTANLRALFPCGDNMVCIIDDREDVWNFAPNLIHVKPYHFFQHTGDINAPPGLAKRENDDKGDYDFMCLGDGKKGKSVPVSNQLDQPRMEPQKDAIDLVKKKSDDNCADHQDSKENDAATVPKTIVQEVSLIKSTGVVAKIKENSLLADKLSEEITVTQKSEEEGTHDATVIPDSNLKLALDDDGKETTISTGNVSVEEKIHDSLSKKDIAQRDIKDPKSEEIGTLDAKDDKCKDNLKLALGDNGKETTTSIGNVSVEEKIHDSPAEEDIAQRDIEDPKLEEVGTLDAKDDKCKDNISESKDAEQGNGESEKLEPQSQGQANLENSTLKAQSKDEKVDENDSKVSDISSNMLNNRDLKLKKSDEVNDMKSDEIEVADHDDYLLYLEEILKRIHKEFYKRVEDGEKPDMKDIVPAVRKRVLEGTNLVFSGLVPNNIPLERSRAYQVAVSLGANVTQDLNKKTTHLVAVRPGTVKVNSARRMKNIFMVTADWLWISAERWERVDEKVFPLGRNRAGTRHPPAHCGSPEHSSVSKENPSAPTSSSGRNRTASGRFMDTINPLLSFSSADIADMDQEVNDIFDESESDGEKEGNTTKTKQMPVPELEPESDEDKQPVVLPLPKSNQDEESESSSSSADSLSGEHPHGWSKHNLKRKRRDLALGTGTATESDGDEEADDMPSTKFRRGEALPSDLDLGENESESPGSEDPPDEMDDGDWNMMGAALEREFLS